MTKKRFKCFDIDSSEFGDQIINDIDNLVSTEMESKLEDEDLQDAIAFLYEYFNELYRKYSRELLTGVFTLFKDQYYVSYDKEEIIRRLAETLSKEQLCRLLSDAGHLLYRYLSIKGELGKVRIFERAV